MKHNSQFRTPLLLISLVLILFLISLQAKAQNITLEFANVQQTSPDAGVTFYYEADIMISSNIEFYLGSGQLYLNYNTNAFGPNISGSGGLAYTHGINGGDYLLDEHFSGSPVYNNFMQNDDTESRVSISFEQLIGTGSGSPNNITAIPQPLMHIRMLYTNPSEVVNICFESNAPFDDLFYTSCGGASATADCSNFPGIQLTNDIFDCSNSNPTLLSTEQNNEAIAMKLFPNPTSNKFIIESDITSEMSIQVNDIHGRLINYIEEYDGNPISTSDLQTGIYLLLIETDKIKTIKKLIIE
ncbi:MAG: T9SS type A sorting domain-containing protein [Flavobacteriaceae bacterium]|nr:T9SS type A sorting domain-containing protein [Flavobacteriaceae bacterium]